MNGSLVFNQNIIAMMWDFDKTLIRTYMQDPLFRHYGFEPGVFWDQIAVMPDLYAQKGVELNRETCYLNLMIDYAKQGRMSGLNNAKLRESGQWLDFFDGLPDFFPKIQQYVANNPEYAAYDIKLEHYIISGGLTEVIRGSKIAPFVEGITACEFTEHEFDIHSGRLIETDNPQISGIGFTTDNTTKTRAIYQINKGVNKFPDQLHVNQIMRDDERRVPFTHMIYIADGPSDIPAFSVVKRFGGRTLAVYERGRIDSFRQASKLLEAGRVHMFGEADYSEGSQTYIWLQEQVRQIADNICQNRKHRMAQGKGSVPSHI